MLFLGSQNGGKCPTVSLLHLGVLRSGGTVGVAELESDGLVVVAESDSTVPLEVASVVASTLGLVVGVVVVNAVMEPVFKVEVAEGTAVAETVVDPIDEAEYEEKD